MYKKPIILLGLLLPLAAVAQPPAASAVEQDRLSQAAEDAFASDDDGDLSEGQGISSVLVLSHDAFLDNAAYSLFPFRFRPRGYDQRYERTMINGIEFNDSWRGVFNYTGVGALNDFTRQGDQTLYTAANGYSFGSVGGVSNLNLRPSAQQAGHKATISLTNRNYYSRAMYSYNTGLRDNGWAFSTQIGARYSHEGAVEGTFYRNIAAALGVEKQLNGGRHSLSLVAFASPQQRGQQGSSFEEVYRLVDNNLYNPNWGYQNGKKRNARVVQAWDPTTVFSHVYKPNERVNLTTSLSYHYGRYGQTALNWYDGADPRPDYYRNLPSWFAADPYTHDYYTDLWRSHDPSVTQINWDELYRINQLSVQAGNGSSIYMIEERRSDLSEGAVSSVLNYEASRNNRVTVGVNGRLSTSHQFKTVDDLMGGQYVLDVDKFSERDLGGANTEITNNDLNRPGRRVYEGDVFGYDFKVRTNTAGIWAQSQYEMPWVDWYYGAKFQYTATRRDGAMRNGRFPNSSFGKGTQHRFYDLGFKAGATFKITGRHLIQVNAAAYTEAPTADRIYVSSRISDNTGTAPVSGKIFSIDASYVFSLANWRGRVGVYNTAFEDMRERQSYYHDSERTFVNHMLTGVNKIHRGVEAGVEYRLNEMWSFDFAGNWGDYRYTSRPDGVISYENNSKPDQQETVYLKNYKVGGVPQAVGSLGVNFFYKYWFIDLKGNIAGRNYVQPSALRRLASTYALLPDHAGVDPTDPAMMEAFHKLVDQERYKTAFTLDLSVGKIIYLKNRQSLNLNLTVNNLLNNKNIRTGGYEQGRFDLNDADRFMGKYYYMQGINAFLNISYRF